MLYEVITFCIVQHRQQRVFRIAYELDHLRTRALHVRHDSLRLGKRVTDAADDDRACFDRLGNLFFIPELAVAVRPFFGVDQRRFADFADVADGSYNFV